jgi:hypothetical protein
VEAALLDATMSAAGRGRGHKAVDAVSPGNEVRRPRPRVM